MRLVKCAICEKQFDMETVQGVKYSARRFAHQACWPSGEMIPLKQKKEQTTLVVPKEDLAGYRIVLDLYRDLFHPPQNSGEYPKLIRDIKRLIEERKYSCTGMAKTLTWYLNVKHQLIPTEEAFMYVLNTYYEEAMQYYYFLYLITEENKKKLENTQSPQTKVIEISPIQPPEKKIKLFDI